MEKIEIPLKPIGVFSSKFTYRLSYVEFLIIEGFLDGKPAPIETPDAVVYCKGYIYLNEKISEAINGRSIPILYDGETVYIQNGARAELLGTEYKISEDTVDEMFELDLEDYEIALIHECFSEFSTDGYIHTPIIAEIRAGRKIQAIKAYRVAHGVGLRESKNAVEKIWDHVRSGL